MALTHEIPEPVHWHWHETETNLGSRFDAAGEWQKQLELVKQNRRRSVYRLAFPDRSFYVKHDHPVSLRNKLKSPLRCKCEEEYLSGHALADAGISTVRYVGWAQAGLDSLVVSEEVPNACTFAEAWRHVRTTEHAEPFLDAVGRFFATLVNSGIRHPDLHSGNILVTDAEGQPAFHLLDVYGATIRSLSSADDALPILAVLVPICRELDGERLQQLIRQIMDGQAGTVTWLQLQRWIAQRHRKRWPGIRKRLLTNSSICSRQSTASGTWTVMTDELAVDHAEDALAQHLKCFETGGDGIVKDDAKRCLSKVRVGDRTLIVKEYRRPGPWGRWRADVASWLDTYRIGRLYGIPVGACIGALRHQDRRGFLVFEYVSDTTVEQHWITDGCTARSAELVDQVARLVAWLHAAGIYHRDLNPANMMITDDPGLGLKLIDCDRVAFYRHMVPHGRREQNLAQVLEAIDNRLSTGEREQFLTAYRAEMDA